MDKRFRLDADNAEKINKVEYETGLSTSYIVNALLRKLEIEPPKKNTVKVSLDDLDINAVNKNEKQN